MTVPNIKCPKCGGMSLAKNGGGKRPRWVCQVYEGGHHGRRIYCYSTRNPNAPYRGQNMKPKVPDSELIFERKLSDRRRYIITAAQNATPVHRAFWACLQTAAKHLRAEILVVPIRYKNPTSRWTDSQENAEWWAAEVTPFLWNVRKQINQNLTLLADIKTQPTASDPLRGYDSISGASSAIIGHTKLQLKCVATPQNKMPKILTTTGACTRANYSDSRAGKLGEFHHSLAAVLVEVKGKIFHLRQLNFDMKSGSFTDLDTQFFPGMVKDAPPPEALVMGDTHVDFIDEKVEEATFGAKGIVAALRPRRLIWHDLLDAYAVNPHHAGNVFNAIAKMRADRTDARAELYRAVSFVIRQTPVAAKSFVVASNHNDFLTRWMINTDPRTTPANFEFWCETGLAMARATKLDRTGTRYPSPVVYWGRKLCGSHTDVQFLDRDESLLVAGIELGMHGDIGPSGARGSIRNLRRIGVRSIVGHSHTPGIEEGCYQVGTSTPLRLEYTSGPGSWLNTHCLVHADGKRQLINIIGGEWRI